MILTGKDKIQKSSASGNELSPSMAEQLHRILDGGKDNDTASMKRDSDEKTNTAKAKRKEKNADTLNLVLPKGERKLLKSFCAENGISMTEYAFTCMDYIRCEVQEGRMAVSRSGIRKIRKDEK